MFCLTGLFHFFFYKVTEKQSLLGFVWMHSDALRTNSFCWAKNFFPELQKRKNKTKKKTEKKQNKKNKKATTTCAFICSGLFWTVSESSPINFWRNRRHYIIGRTVVVLHQ